MMMNLYIAKEHGTKKRLSSTALWKKNLGLDAVMFLVDLNISCGRQQHWILINNAFQSSDRRKYRVSDGELHLIFGFVSFVLDTTVLMDQYSQQKLDKLRKNKHKKSQEVTDEN